MDGWIRGALSTTSLAVNHDPVESMSRMKALEMDGGFVKMDESA